MYMIVSSVLSASLSPIPQKIKIRALSLPSHILFLFLSFHLAFVRLPHSPLSPSCLRNACQIIC